ncbi:hypothetical protein, partial [Streptomyces mirabilis]|uniref:hypothetical protein n=1 Tax=Streptomyces mirabilis TaxID=68239 RepID=UPI00331C8794
MRSHRSGLLPPARAVRACGRRERAHDPRASVGYVAAAALTKPLEPAEPPLADEGDLFDLTIE